MSSSPAMCIRLGLSAVLLTVFTTLAPAARAQDDCLTLQAGRLGEGFLVVLGSRSPQVEIPDLRLPGCGSAAPGLSLRWTRDRSGRWSAAGELPPGLAGVVFGHRSRPWALDLPRRLRQRTAVISLAPLVPAIDRGHHEIPREPDTIGVAAAALDKWTFAVAQQLSGGRVLAEELATSGPHEGVERMSRLSLDTDWPPGTRLESVAGQPGTMALFSRGPSGEILTALVQGETWRAAVPLDLPAAVETRGAWLDGAPAVVARGPDALTLWTLSGVAWLNRGSIPAPSGRPWTAAPTARSGQLAVVAWNGTGLEAWLWEAGAFQRELVPQARETSVLRSPLPTAPKRAGRSWPTVVLSVALLALGALIGAALWGKLSRRR